MKRREFLSQSAQATATAAVATAATAATAALSATGCGGGTGYSTEGVEIPPGVPEPSYFEQLTQDLSEQGYGTPQILIDLDRLEQNADAIREEIGADRYRIVEKSLPSLDLLRHVSERSESNRFLVLHLPFLPALLAEFPEARVLVGKVQPVAAVDRFFSSLAEEDRADAAARVQFLVDSRTRLDELATLAADYGVTLEVGVEIDVGLHRGGVRRPSELPSVLEAFSEHRDSIRFIGMLGYDGHVIGAPVAPGLERGAVMAAHRAVEDVFREAKDVVVHDFPELFRDDLIFSSGGTSTYPLHHGGVVNDVAAGGGMLRPASYSDMFISELSPAVFIAAPVIAHFDEVELPFVKDVGRALMKGSQSFTIYGGGWAAPFVWPEGVALAPLVSDPENLNLVPNQALLTAPQSPRIGPGDWIFQYPRLADAIFPFENILLVRNGRLLTETWRSYPRRY